MKFGKIGAALSTLLGVDTTDMTEVELAAAVEDAASKTENIVVETTTEIVETVAEESVNYSEVIEALTARVTEAEASVERMGTLVSVLTTAVSKMSVASATPAKSTTVVAGVAKLTDAVAAVEDTTKKVEGLNLNEFGKIASIK